MLHWRPISKRRKNKGFTLVEFLIVAAIFSFVALGIGGSFLTGLRVWDRARNTDFLRGNIFLVLETFAQDLRQGIDFNSIRFEGFAAEVSFPSLSGNQILKVTYKFDLAEKKIVRQEVNLKDILSIEGEKDKRVEKVLLEVDDLKLEYLGFDKFKAAYAWTDAWVKEDGVFTAVKLRIINKDEEFTKTVFMPFAK